MDAQHTFRSFLSKQHLKITPERLTVLNEILQCHKHFDPDSLFLRLKAQSKKISRATIYRTLDLLVESGLLKKLNFTDQNARYEMNMDVRIHDHFFCISCGKIIELYDESLQMIHQRFASEYNLKIDDYTHQLYGTCPQCRNSESR
jgi:Fur family ferric uptake transcriptional regulator